MNRVYREGDIVKWSYVNPKHNTYEYHCVSQIAVFNGKEFIDTFWSSSSSSTFFESEIGDKYKVDYVGNFDELEECHKGKFSYYDKSDCIDLSHPNDTRGNTYIRVGAKKSLWKIQRLLEGHIESLESSIRYKSSQVDRFKEDLVDLTEDNYIPTDELWVYDDEGVQH
tara:strand:- start:12866 stop:13369 length:504 start_codon:yes stop_codon:yes gene_type:complete